MGGLAALRVPQEGIVDYAKVCEALQKEIEANYKGVCEQIAREHLYHSRVLEGFELDTRWLWQRPLPATMPIVRRLLGEE